MVYSGHLEHVVSGYKTNDLKPGWQEWRGKKRPDYLHLAEQKPDVFQAKSSNPGWLMRNEGLTPRARGHHFNVNKRGGVMF